MALKAVIETLDDVPEAIHGEYEKRTVNGKEIYVLNVSGIDDHPQVRNLKTAHEAVKSKRDELKTQLESINDRLEGVPDDFTGQVYRTLKAAADGKTGEPLKEDQVKEIRADERKRVMKEVQPQIDELNRIKPDLQRTKIDDGLTRSLINHGVSKEFLPAARAMLKEKGKISLVEEDGVFNAKVDNGLGPQSLEEYVKDWVGSDEGKPFIAKAAGGDAGGSKFSRTTDDNPFVAPEGGKPNLTAIQELVVKDPEKARAKAREAKIPQSQLSRYGLS